MLTWEVRASICSPAELKPKREKSSISVPEDVDLPEDCPDAKRRILALKWPEPVWQLQTHRACAHNEERIARNRVMMEVPGAESGSLHLVDVAAGELAKQVVAAPLDLESLIQVFPASRRKRYLQAAWLLCQRAFSLLEARISSFVKSEKLEVEEKDKDPRMIQARGQLFNLELGKFTRAIEKGLYSLKDPAWQEVGIANPLLAKGSSLNQRAVQLRRMWKLLRNPVSLSFDLSRWDAHVGVEMLKIMHKFYLKVIPDPWLGKLLEQQLLNKATTANGIKYRNPGGVTSGDMTTALGNCVAVSAILLAFRAVLQRIAEGKGLNTYGSPLLSEIKQTVIRYLNMHPNLRTLFLTQRWMCIYDDGDDHVLLVEKPAAQLVEMVLPKWWQAVGQDLKIEGVTEQFSQIEFCQHKPLKLANGRWVMAPNPFKVLATATLVSGNNRLKPEKYLLTVWEARAMLHNGVPVLGPLFSRWASKRWVRERLTAKQLGQEAAGIAHLVAINAQKGKQKQIPITPEVRETYAQQWGISADEQALLEQVDLERPTPNQRVPLIKYVKTLTGLNREPHGMCRISGDLITQISRRPGWFSGARTFLSLTCLSFTSLLVMESIAAILTS